MIKSLMFGLTFLALVGCTQKEQIVVTKTIPVGVPESLLVGCKMEPVRMDYQSYESAFYAARDAYVATAKNVAVCNSRYEKAREFQTKEMGRLDADN